MYEKGMVGTFHASLAVTQGVWEYLEKKGSNHDTGRDTKLTNREKGHEHTVIG